MPFVNNCLLKKSIPFTGRAVDVFAAFRDQPYPFLLDSSLRHAVLGRFSLLGFDPFEIIKSSSASSLAALRPALRRYRLEYSHLPPVLTGGMMGYLSYDFGLRLQGLHVPAEQVPQGAVAPVPDYLFGLYDCVLVFDHYARRLSVFSSGFPLKDPVRRRQRAAARIKEVMRRLNSLPVHPTQRGQKPAVDRAGGGAFRLQSNFTPADYLNTVRRALDYIARGDIYQVNLAQRFSLDGQHARRRIQPFDIYCSLRRLSPACFHAFFDAGDFQIISSSPERFLRLHDGRVETRPMKGTRPRGRSPAQDRIRQRQLWRSRKDQAELLMITDLQRNDLGRVCRYGSVGVSEMRTLEKYATVFQTTSTVAGRLRDGQDPLDLLQAAFPGGSITGCPKIRAMQIINELEPSPRSIYTGALGYIGFQGDMDFNILIRTLLVKDSKIVFHAGGGIVADSDPQREFEETLVKAQAMRACLNF